MSSKKGQKYIYAQEQTVLLLLSLWRALRKIKLKKMTTTQSEEFHQTLEENVNKHCNGFSILIGCLILTFHSFISVG